jgi:hypothetical protein
MEKLARAANAGEEVETLDEDITDSVKDNSCFTVSSTTNHCQSGRKCNFIFLLSAPCR